MNLETGKRYRILFPNGRETVAELEEIRTYGMSSDYLFRYKSGDKTLISAFKIPGMFSLPVGLIPWLKDIRETK